MAQTLFEQPRITLAHRFSNHISGGSQSLVMVISQRTLDQTSIRALSNSTKALGYSVDPSAGDLLFVTLVPQSSTNKEPERFTGNTEPDGPLGADALLGARDLGLLVETLDPLCLICTDLAATECLAKAYHARLSLDVTTTLLGRPLRCFKDFGSMVSDNQQKQSAWKLLKSLPHK